MLIILLKIFKPPTMNIKEENYTPYSVEWENQLMKMSKRDIVEIFRKGMVMKDEMLEECRGLKKVVAAKDDSGHWYLVPNEIYDQFRADLEDEEMADSGEFDVKYGIYRTGGDINNKQLYIN